MTHKLRHGVSFSAQSKTVAVASTIDIADAVKKACERRTSLDYFRQVRGLTDDEIVERRNLSKFIYDNTVVSHKEKQETILLQIKDFEWACTDLLNRFINSFTVENGCLGYVNYHEGIECFSSRGLQLYERYRSRLSKIGARMFPGYEFTVEADILANDEDGDED